MKLFKRIIRVVIGQEDSTALSIDSLYIQIEIKKNISGKPNEGVVKIYNLSDSSENQIREKGVRIRVFAGHNEKPVLLHDGDIRRVERDADSSGLNRITSIYLGGNMFRLTQAIFNKAYSGQVSVKQIVQDAVPTFGLELSDIDQIPDNEFLNDYSFTGKTSDCLNEILNPINVQWFENDNFIKFSTEGKTLESVVLLNSDSGLIGSPSVTDKGVQFRSVLNGRIVLNNQIKIESIRVNGVYKITDIEHVGDNRNGKFESLGVGGDFEQ